MLERCVRVCVCVCARVRVSEWESVCVCACVRASAGEMCACVSECVCVRASAGEMCACVCVCVRACAWLSAGEMCACVCVSECVCVRASAGEMCVCVRDWVLERCVRGQIHLLIFKASVCFNYSWQMQLLNTEYIMWGGHSKQTQWRTNHRRTRINKPAAKRINTQNTLRAGLLSSSTVMIIIRDGQQYIPAFWQSSK